MINIKEILGIRGLDLDARIRIVRHKDKHYDVDELHRLGQLEIYQSYQTEKAFDCDNVVVFIATESTLARFVGVYKVKGKKPGKDTKLPKDFLYPEMPIADLYFFELEEVPGFEDLKERMVIEWGQGALSWNQWLKEKEVVEILPEGFVGDFPGYLEFILWHDELRKIVESPTANRVWHKMLSGVAGVYLIVDTRTGSQYVGSAYGKMGILGRWTEYAKNGHGGNDQLMDLLKDDKNYATNFRFTILAVTSTTSTQKEVLRLENLYKDKLGSRAHGLNSN